MKQLNWYQIFGKSNIPDGRAVLPTDDIQIWLNCANIWDKTYTTLAEVLADTDTLSALITSNNAVDYMVRSTTWASGVSADSSAMTYIGQNNYCANTLLADATWKNAICNSEYFESVLNVKVPTMTDNTHPSGVCSSTALQAGNAYYAFDKNASTNIVFNNRQGRIIYKFPEEVDIYLMKVTPRAGLNPPQSMLKSCTVDHSADGNTWVNIASITVANSVTEQTFLLDKTNDLYFSLYATGDVWNTGINNSGVTELNFYGRKDV